MKRAGLLLALALGFGVWQGHEFWLSADAYRLAPGQATAVRTLVGEHFQGLHRPFRASKALRLSLTSPQAQTVDLRPQLAGHDSVDHILATPANTGTHVLVYEGSPTYIELPAAKFDAYLAEDRLDAVRQARQAAGDTTTGRELYSRHCKALLHVGDGATATHATRPLGLALELTPAHNPYAVPPAAPLRVQLHFQGRPLAGAKVVARHRAGATYTETEARTDARGWVQFPLDKPGVWLVSAVHMVPHPHPAEAGYRSYWASLTFAR